MIQEATDHEILLLHEIGADRGHNGVVDPDFFNPEEIQRDFHTTNAVFSIAVNVQRPLTSQTFSRTGVTAGLEPPRLPCLRSSSAPPGGARLRRKTGANEVPPPPPPPVH